MATSAQQTKPPQHERKVVEFLKRYLEMAEKGEIQSVVLGYVKTDGGAAVQSTPISTIMMNHLSTLLEIRVAREYRLAMEQAAGPAASTGARGVPEKPRVEAQLPRAVRRAMQKSQQKLAVKAAKKKLAPEPVREATPPAAPNGTGK